MCATVSRGKWSAPVSNAEAYRRAGGRKHINAVRQMRQLMRRAEISEQFGKDVILLRRGIVTRVAQAFGVSVATASRDCAWVRRHQVQCPLCLGAVDPEFLKERTVVLERELRRSGKLAPLERVPRVRPEALEEAAEAAERAHQSDPAGAPPPIPGRLGFIEYYRRPVEASAGPPEARLRNGYIFDGTGAD